MTITRSSMSRQVGTPGGLGRKGTAMGMGKTPGLRTGKIRAKKGPNLAGLAAALGAAGAGAPGGGMGGAPMGPGPMAGPPGGAPMAPPQAPMKKGGSVCKAGGGAVTGSGRSVAKAWFKGGWN